MPRECSYLYKTRSGHNSNFLLLHEARWGTLCARISCCWLAGPYRCPRCLSRSYVKFPRADRTDELGEFALFLPPGQTGEQPRKIHSTSNDFERLASEFLWRFVPPGLELEFELLNRLELASLSLSTCQKFQVFPSSRNLKGTALLFAAVWNFQFFCPSPSQRQTSIPSEI